MLCGISVELEYKKEGKGGVRKDRENGLILSFIECWWDVTVVLLPITPCWQVCVHVHAHHMFESGRVCVCVCLLPGGERWKEVLPKSPLHLRCHLSSSSSHTFIFSYSLSLLLLHFHLFICNSLSCTSYTFALHASSSAPLHFCSFSVLPLLLYSSRFPFHGAPSLICDCYLTIASGKPWYHYET